RLRFLACRRSGTKGAGNDVRDVRLWRALLGVDQRTVIEGIEVEEFEEEDADGDTQVVLEGDAPRVNCPSHGPTVVAVPWARHHAGHTLAFDDTVAWLAVACSKTAVCELMRVAWRTVG